MFSTITSTYPAIHNVRVEYQDTLSSNQPTIAEELSKAGYHTVFLRQSEHPAILNSDNHGLRGYAQVIRNKPYNIIKELSNSTVPWFIHLYIGLAHMPYTLPDNTPLIEDIPAPVSFPTYESDYNDALGAYVKQHLNEIFEHKVIEDNKEILSSHTRVSNIKTGYLFQSICEPNPIGNCKKAWAVERDAFLQFIQSDSKSDIAYIRMLYDTVLREIDTKLADIYNLVQQAPYNKNTIVIVMSDHGEAFGEHGVFSHDPNNHSELLTTPLIIKAPNLPKGFIDYPSSNMDIFPTILDLLGIQKPQGLQGISILQYPKGARQGNERFVISQNYDWGVFLQNKDWLYFLSESTGDKRDSILYHKVTDPHESINVADKYPELVNSLYSQALLIRSYDELSATNTPQQQKTDSLIDQDTLERLRKEGYF